MILRSPLVHRQALSTARPWGCPGHSRQIRFRHAEAMGQPCAVRQPRGSRGNDRLECIEPWSRWPRPTQSLVADRCRACRRDTLISTAHRIGFIGGLPKHHIGLAFAFVGLKHDFKITSGLPMCRVAAARSSLGRHQAADVALPSIRAVSGMMPGSSFSGPLFRQPRRYRSHLAGVLFTVNLGSLVDICERTWGCNRRATVAQLPFAASAPQRGWAR